MSATSLPRVTRDLALPAVCRDEASMALPFSALPPFRLWNFQPLSLPPSLLTVRSPLPTISFRINTYETSRKCCIQRTYRIAKSFRFRTYKKQGGGGVMVNQIPSTERRGWQVSSHAGLPFRPRSQSVSTPDPKLTLCTDGSVAIGG